MSAGGPALKRRGRATEHGAGQATEPSAGTLTPDRRRRRIRNALIGLFVCALVLVGGVAVSAAYLTHRLDSHLHRIPNVFSGLKHRPPVVRTGTAAAAVNILLMGTDRRSDVPTTGTTARAPDWVPGAQRTDALMILHIDGDRRGASVISLPRDSWVSVPGWGHAKINAAFSFAGPSLAVHTVERLTGIHIDHLAVVDWAGFKAITDVLGGVTVDIPRTTYDSYRDITWTAGKHRLTGEQALDYVGQRAGLPGGDFARIHRQQYFLGQLADTVLEKSLVKSPTRTFKLLDTLTRYASVDSGWHITSMAKLAFSLRNLRSSDVHYLTAPVRGTGWEGAQSVVYLDHAVDVGLWKAVRLDRVDRWVGEHPESRLPAVVD